MSIFEYDEEKHMKSEREEFFRRGLEEGEVRGREAEREERTRSVVLNLLKIGMPDEQICKVAECDLHRIEEIRKTSKLKL